jgi:hypothetical protein
MSIDKEYFIFAVVAWQSAGTETGRLIPYWSETVLGANGANGGDFARASVSLLVRTIHVSIICQATTPPKHVTVCSNRC